MNIEIVFEKQNPPSNSNTNILVQETPSSKQITVCLFFCLDDMAWNYKSFWNQLKSACHVTPWHYSDDRTKHSQYWITGIKRLQLDTFEWGQLKSVAGQM